jgi:hypothetical protein
MDTPPKPTAFPASEPYGSEVLCASWNPQVPALAGPARGAQDALAGVAAQDVDALLKRLYLIQQA